MTTFNATTFNDIDVHPRQNSSAFDNALRGQARMNPRPTQDHQFGASNGAVGNAHQSGASISVVGSNRRRGWCRRQYAATTAEPGPGYRLS
jgi:hypothetical protein